MVALNSAFFAMWALVIALLASDASAAEATPRERAYVSTAASRQAQIIERVVLRGDAAAVEYALRQVARGLPPASLSAFLGAAAKTPRVAYVPALWKLTRYRSETIRARAFVALAAVDHDRGQAAAMSAMDDPSLSIRLLGLQLAETHTSPRTEEAAILLLDRDREVAEIRRRSRAGS